MKIETTSEEAIAIAAIESNISLASGYPGSPGGGVMSEVVAMNNGSIDAHWSCNEKIALEKGIGAATMGLNALVTVKSVGLNAMLDPLTVANLTPLQGSLVIIVGDDPGGYGSQNDQDSRRLAEFLNLPWFEAITVQSAYNLTLLGFKVSKKYGFPVFIRITRYLANLKDQFKEFDFDLEPTTLFDNWVNPRYVPVPKNAVAKNIELVKRISAFKQELKEWPMNRINGIKTSDVTIIACGGVYSKLISMLGDYSELSLQIVKLESIYPLPEELLGQLFIDSAQVIIIEENSSVIWSQCNIIALNYNPKLELISIAQPGDISSQTLAEELIDASHIFHEYDFNLPDFKPTLKSNCGKSRYGELLDLLDLAASNADLKLNYYGDPGCLVAVADRLTAKYAMGGSVSTIYGASLKSIEGELNLAVIGDSGLFHSALLAIADSVYHKANIPMVLINNNSALTTGGQKHIGSTQNGQIFDYKKLFEGVGLDNYWRINLDNKRDLFLTVVKDFLVDHGPRILIIDIETV